MTPEDLARAIRQVASGVVPEDLPVHVERATTNRTGWATNLALVLAARSGMPSRALADRLAARVRRLADVAAVEVEGPGLLIITPTPAAAGELAQALVTQGVGDEADGPVALPEPPLALRALGRDVARFEAARSAGGGTVLAETTLRRRHPSNPVFLVQYAHARARAADRLAAQDGVRRADGFAPALLTDRLEGELLAQLAEHRRVVRAARAGEVHLLARGLEGVATAYLLWQERCPLRPARRDEEVTDLHRTRLWLNEATRTVLAHGLGLLGVAAPERM